MATSDRLQRDVPTCPECPGRVRPIDGEQTCENCGLVVEADPIDHGPDWLGGYDPDTREQVVRAKPGDRDYHDRGLGSVIGRDDRLGTSLDNRRRTRMNKRVRTGDKTDRNRGYGTSEIQRLAGALGLGDALAKQATRLFRDLHGGGDAVGRNLDKLTAGAVLAVARIHQRGLVPGDVATPARTDADGVRRGYAILRETVPIEVPPPDARQRVRVVARETGIGSAARERALRAIEDMDEATVANGSPSTLAAALLWQASEETQSRVADAAGVTPTGLRKRWQRIEREGVDL